MKNFFFIISIALFFSSCTKDFSEEFTPYNENLLNDTSWKKIVNANAPVNQITDKLSEYRTSYIDSFNVNSGGIMFFSDGVKITFPANAYTDKNGNAIIGDIAANVTYLNKKGDYIKFSKSCFSNTEMLNALACFRIKLVQKNGNDVFIDSNNNYKVFFKTNNNNLPAKLFYEDLIVNNNDTSLAWMPSSPNAVGNNFGIIASAQTPGFSGALMSGYEFLTRRRNNWMFAAVKSDSISQPVKVNVALPIIFTNNNTQVFLVNKNKDFVARLQADVSNKTFFFPKIAQNTEAIIISITKIGNDYYYGEKQITLQNSNLIYINPQIKSINNIVSYLDAL